MSLCNWLPPHSAATNTHSAGDGSSAHHAPIPYPPGHMQSRQQCQAVSPQHQVPQQQQQQHLQQHGFVGDQMCGTVGQQGQASWQQHAKPASAQRTAERKRRQCLLEIERELLRHSSDEDVPPDDMQLPQHNAGKRRKTACTGEDQETFALDSNAWGCWVSSVPGVNTGVVSFCPGQSVLLYASDSDGQQDAVCKCNQGRHTVQVKCAKHVLCCLS